MLVYNGHQYMGGAAKPFFTTNGMIVAGAEGKGFTNVRVIDRDKYPAAELPPIPDGTSDDWNVIGTGTWGQADQDLSLPGEVRWFVDVTQGQQPSATPQYTPPDFPMAPAPAPQDGGQTAPPYFYDPWTAPPVEPVVVPQDLPWTTVATSPATVAAGAAAIGAAAALLFLWIRG